MKNIYIIELIHILFGGGGGGDAPKECQMLETQITKLKSPATIRTMS